MFGFVLLVLALAGDVVEGLEELIMLGLGANVLEDETPVEEAVVELATEMEVELAVVAHGAIEGEFVHVVSRVIVPDGVIVDTNT
jgi:hypothetical protein